jgi:chaperonin cofactor prefoldin
MGITKAQMTAKQRDIRMLQLTSKELSELPLETRVYEGVGKMYVFSSHLICRFFACKEFIVGTY